MNPIKAFRNGEITRDQLFLRFVIGLLVILTLYGAGMFISVLWGNVTLASRLVSGFSTMFAGILGLGSGYLLGTAAPRTVNETENKEVVTDG